MSFTSLWMSPMVYRLKFFKWKSSSSRTPIMHIFLAKGRETVAGGKYSLVRQYFLKETFLFQDVVV